MFTALFAVAPECPKPPARHRDFTFMARPSTFWALPVRRFGSTRERLPLSWWRSGDPRSKTAPPLPRQAPRVPPKGMLARLTGDVLHSMSTFTTLD